MPPTFGYPLLPPSAVEPPPDHHRLPLDHRRLPPDHHRPSPTTTNHRRATTKPPLDCYRTTTGRRRTTTSHHRPPSNHHRLPPDHCRSPPTTANRRQTAKGIFGNEQNFSRNLIHLPNTPKYACLGKLFSGIIFLELRFPRRKIETPYQTHP